MARILILGGYGFIGAEIVHALLREGHAVVGLGRNADIGRRFIAGAEWIGVDMARLDTPEKWAPHLAGVDAIVNAAGALQDGARDDLEAIHHRSIATLVEAARKANIKMFVQISAPGAEANASTAFLRTKAAGDEAVRASLLDWVVFKPGLVIGRNAYGGTGLLRMLAGFPLMTPLVHGSARVQTVSIDDVVTAVVAALNGEIPLRRDYDLVEDEPHSLRDIVRGFRGQLGFAPARLEPDLPQWVANIVGLLADLAGLLGWRSALRSTALSVMREDVLGDPAPWRAATGRAATGRALKSFGETLPMIAATAQERLYARAQLALPLMIAALGIFWIVSGAIGLAAIGKAALHLDGLVGVAAAKALVVAGSLVDMAIGAGLLMRRSARAAAIASVLVAAFYLIAGTMTEPSLWLDPFGALVKIFPIMALGLAVALLLEDR